MSTGIDVPALVVDGVPRWGQVRTVYLRELSKQILGPTRGPAGDNEHSGFTVTCLANGEIIVTLTPDFDLAGVYDLCEAITKECLDGGEDIDFTRDPTEADTRVRQFGRDD